MNYSDMIQATQSRLVTAKDSLHAKMAEHAEGKGDDSLGAEIDSLLDQVERESIEVQRLTRLEKAMGARALPVALATPGAPTIIPPPQMKVQPSADLFIRGAVCALEGFYTRRDPLDVVKSRYGDDEVAAFMVALTTKAAQAPATTFTAGYAAELVRQTYRAWMDAIAEVAVLPRLPFRPENFDDGSPIIYPSRNPAGVSPSNFAAMWRKEGDPIRVGVLSMSSQEMKPYSAGVIGHFTKELFKRSTPNIEQVIRQAIVEDTAVMLDGYFFSNTAGVADVRPPGIMNGIPAGDTYASTGTAYNQVEADLNKMITRLLVNNRLGQKPVWVMNTINAAALGSVVWPMGGAVYPGMGNIAATTATLKGFPLYAGSAVPAAVVLFMDASQIAFAGGTPAWEVSDQATIHEENTTPLTIDAGAPVRSLFQTHSAAVKAVYELSWLILRAGAVQALTGVGWASGITPPVILTAPATP